MIWVECPGYPDYEISEHGHVRRPRACATRSAGHVLRGSWNSRYLRYKLSRDGVKVYASAHSLVCLAFNGPRPFPGAVCRHLDDNRANNHRSNLAWGTIADNAADAKRNGRVSSASNGRALLDWCKVREIRSKFTGKYGEMAALSRQYGIAHSQIREICHGESWQE